MYQTEQEIIDRLARSAERFSYDHSEQTFRVGQRVIELIKLKDDDFLVHDFAPDCILDEDKNKKTLQRRKKDIRDSAVLLLQSFDFIPVVTPAFYQFISSQTDSVREKLFTEVREIMCDTYKATAKHEWHDSLDKTDAFGHIGYSVGDIRPEWPSLVFQTMGNCACMFPEVSEGNYINPRDRELTQAGWAEYAFHNNDTPAQTISLLSGLGHLAFLADQEHSLAYEQSRPAQEKR